MARSDHQYVCQSCGAVHAKWVGRCESCGEWSTLAEEAAPKAVPKGLRLASGGGTQRLPLFQLKGTTEGPARVATANAELDRVLGGGLVEGSAVLLGGDPGIGKSTLVLQAGAALAAAGTEVAYVSGEESVDQIRLRAARLGCAEAPLQVAAATSVRDILATFDHLRAPRLLIIDSIQTMYVDSVESAPGTVTQLRTSAHELIRFAKRRGTALFLIGHVTKDGQIAGPRVLEHMVDAVLYFEGERSHQFRILRAVKNRFGAANEIGVFEMAERGLVAGAEPVRAVPRRARGGRLGRRGVRRHRGLAPAAGRDPGAGRPGRARHAAPHRGRLGQQPGSRCCSPCSRPAAGLPSARATSI